MSDDIPPAAQEAVDEIADLWYELTGEEPIHDDEQNELVQFAIEAQQVCYDYPIRAGKTDDVIVAGMRQGWHRRVDENVDAFRDTLEEL